MKQKTPKMYKIFKKVLTNFFECYKIKLQLHILDFDVLLSKSRKNISFLYLLLGGVVILKRKISLILAMAMIVSVLSGMVFVSADGESTSAVTTVLSYNFDSDTVDFAGGGSTTLSSDSTYGIGKSRYITSSKSIPINSTTDESGTTTVTGIDVLSRPNNFVELEFDLKVVENSSKSTNRGGCFYLMKKKELPIIMPAVLMFGI